MAFPELVRLAFEAFVGAAIAAALLRWPRSPQTARQVWSFGLLLAALIYVGFAAASGNDPTRELAGVGFYLLFAIAGWRGSNLALAAGWALHVGWDGLLHLGVPIAPAWYPGVCIGFDLAVAIAFLLRDRSEHTAFRAPVT